jgi:hypothetical protein
MNPAMKRKLKKTKQRPERGVVIPKGTEQETGLTRGKTEKAAQEKANDSDSFVEQ